MDHDVIRNLGEAANDLVTWSNVSFPSALFLKKRDSLMLKHHAYIRISFRTTLNSPKVIPTT